MKNSSNDDLNLELDPDSEDMIGDREVWEFDYTNNLVEDFLEQKILPGLLTFDFENGDENYIPGLASYTLFIKMIEILTSQGWESEQLRLAIDEFVKLPPDAVLH